MELLLRVHTDRRSPLDVAVDIDADEPVARLAEALGEATAIEGVDLRVSSARTGQVFDPDEPVGATGIVSGDELVLGWAQVRPATAAVPIRGVSVDVLAGPDSGHSAVLDRGSYLLGRDQSADLTFGDVTVSHLHLRVDVEADWTVRIAPHEDPQNGVLVNDEPIDEATVVGPDDVVALGSSRVSFREFIRAEHE
ncbi:MAG TPA: FHA domain-containing protein, partial [Acidimicrobiales bacterium]|nr:FHA domain-containing protein [Acidimicrobiales bacterium]